MTKSSAHHVGGSELNLPAFGLIEPERVLASDDLFAVVSDKFPISPGHTLIIPRRPVTRFRELTALEKSRLLEWLGWAQERLLQTLMPPPGALIWALTTGKRRVKRCRSFIST
jgi:diadenosine tetraphosphate (Ap4A) HIT family hydrolase